jgi:hypothetical protein
MLRGIVVGLSLLSITGCSLVNPFVIDSRTRDEAMKTPPQPPMSLPQAKKYAELVNDRYRTALGDQAKLQAWMGIGLIPLSAAAIGLGAAGGPAVAVLATGLAGGAAFGTGTWLINRERQAAYAAGLKAVTCAVDAVGPLGEVDAASLKNGVNTLATDIPNLQRAIAILTPLVGDLERDLKAINPTGFEQHHQVLKEARAELPLATALLTTAETAYASGAELDRVVGGAGERLRVAIDKIVDTVDGIIQATQRDQEALARIISGLGGSYKTITTVPEGLKPTAASESKTRPLSTAPTADPQQRARLDAEAGQVQAALGTLRAVSARVDAARRVVQVEVNHVDVTPLVKKLESCGVNAASIVTGLALEPAPPFTLAKGGTIGFVAKGGVGPYFATIAGPGGTKVTVVPVALQSPAFQISAASDAAAGDYVITVADTSGQVKQAKLVVDGAGTPAPEERGASPGPTTADTSRLPAGAVKAFIDQVSSKVVAVKPADISVKATEIKPADGGVAASVAVDRVGPSANVTALTPAAVVEALRGMTDAGLSASQVTVDLAGFPQKVTEFQRAQTTACAAIPVEAVVAEDSEPLFTPATALADRQKLQQALCTADDGRWGADTKKQLRAYQCETGRMPDGKLNNESKKELLDLRAEAVKKRCPAGPPAPRPSP